MNKTFCDRCKKEMIESIPENKSPFEEAMNAVIDFFRRPIDVVDDSCFNFQIIKKARQKTKTDDMNEKQVDIYVDLCPECRRSFREWFSHPEPQNAAPDGKTIDQVYIYEKKKRGGKHGIST